ncbi:hypothetical protein KCU88_g6675, partial [Aureobasidium melanogenum]
MGPSRLSKTLQGITVTTLASIGGFFVWTKHCQFTPDDQFNPATEPLFRSQWFQKFNPGSNPTTHDECVRRLPLHKIRPELLEDARHGGSKLVEAFSQGVWGGFASHPASLVLHSPQLPLLDIRHLHGTSQLQTQAKPFSSEEPTERKPGDWISENEILLGTGTGTGTAFPVLFIVSIHILQI